MGGLKSSSKGEKMDDSIERTTCYLAYESGAYTCPKLNHLVEVKIQHAITLFLQQRVQFHKVAYIAYSG